MWVATGRAALALPAAGRRASTHERSTGADRLAGTSELHDLAVAWTLFQPGWVGAHLHEEIGHLPFTVGHRLLRRSTDLAADNLKLADFLPVFLDPANDPFYRLIVFQQPECQRSVLKRSTNKS